MKCIITYLQHKRAILPYIFSKYCFPEMKRRFPGKLELFHIFQDIDFSNNQMKSNQMDEFHLDKVRKFIDEGKYSAQIIRHYNKNAELSLIPSSILAAKLALKENADLHLWLEDDAILYDLNFEKWKEIECIGSYRNTIKKQMIVCCCFLSRPSFDERMIPFLESYKKESHEKYAIHGSQYEYGLFKLSSSLTLLNEDCYFRHHPYSTYTKTRKDVENWLINHLPISQEDLELLKLDYDE